jgi:hypothetical protein
MGSCGEKSAMRKKLLVTLCSLLLATSPSWAESVEESLKSCGERVRRLNSQPEAQSQAMVLQDLSKVQAGLTEIQKCLQGEGRYSASELGLALSQLQQGLAGMRVSSRLLLRPEEWTVLKRDLERLHRTVKRSTDLFEGRALPTPERLRRTDLDQPMVYPMESVKELERESRAMRFDFDGLKNPGVIGPFGLNGGGVDAWIGQDLQRLRSAVFDYESVCRSPYHQVLQTQSAFDKVVRAYDKLGYYGNDFSSASWRSLGRRIDRLQRFYSALR